MADQRRPVAIVLGVLLGCALAFHAFLLATMVGAATSDDPATDPHGYVQIFGVLLNLVLLPVTLALAIGLLLLVRRRRR